MKILILILAAVVLAISLVADYKWRRWMEARREERDREQGPPRA